MSKTFLYSVLFFMILFVMVKAHEIKKQTDLIYYQLLVIENEVLKLK